MKDSEGLVRAAAAIVLLTSGILIGAEAQQFLDREATRALAISHNCGAYNNRTGEFGWITAQTAQDIILGDQVVKRVAREGGK